jgi:hypothetical protein
MKMLRTSRQFANVHMRDLMAPDRRLQSGYTAEAGSMWKGYDLAKQFVEWQSLLTNRVRKSHRRSPNISAKRQGGYHGVDTGLHVSNSITSTLIESEIEHFASRPANWNTYGARSISMPCKVVALELVALLEARGVIASGVGMTGDSDIILDCRINAYGTKWQIDSDGDVSVMVRRLDGALSYHDTAFSHVADFVERLKHGGV